MIIDMEEKLRISEKEATTKRVPKGTSNYQAAWILESDNEDDDVSKHE